MDARTLAGHGRIGTSVCLLFALSAGTARSADVAEPRAERDPGRDRGAELEPGAIVPSEQLFWASGGLGYGHASVRSFVVRDAQSLNVGVLSSSSGGPSAALASGVRLGQATLGLNAGFIALSDSAIERAVGEGQLWSFDFESTFRVPLERFEPYILLGAGYSSFGSLGAAVTGVFDDEGLDGANLRGGLGFDWFVSQLFSIGARGSYEMLFLKGEISLSEISEARQLETVEEARSTAVRANGSSTGSAYALTIGPGLHF